MPGINAAAGYAEFLTMQSEDGKLRAMVISAIMAAMGLVLPIAFHAVGLGGKFLPMLLPLLLNGFLVPLPWAMRQRVGTAAFRRPRPGCLPCSLRSPSACRWNAPC